MCAVVMVKIEIEMAIACTLQKYVVHFCNNPIRIAINGNGVKKITGRVYYMLALAI